ncbi:MAG: hypothetical protein ABI040_03840 [Rhodoferax sp.]
MKKILLPLSFALAQMLAVSAFAQSANGTADTTATKMPAPATATEKAAARTERKAEGKAAAKDVTPQAEQNDVAHTPHKKATKAQKTAARAKRKAAATAAVKNNEIQHGEAGSTAPAAK